MLRSWNVGLSEMACREAENEASYSFELLAIVSPVAHREIIQ